MTRPILSIITVNLNNNEGLKETLKSIQQQSFTNYEHIIIDGGSADNSLSTITQYAQNAPRVAYWTSEPDHGIYDGMNKGITRAQGEYFYFLNSGDCLNGDILKVIPFDGTQYIYGNAKVITAKKEEDITHPNIPDFIFLSNHSLSHQSCFIHRTLFEDYQYNTDYQIISDWIHCFQCLIFERCSFNHLDIIVSLCDGNGISSDYSKIDEERRRWFQNTLPPQLSKALLECMIIDQSSFRPILPILSRTRQFKKRSRKLIMFLYRIHSFFSGNRR